MGYPLEYCQRHKDWFVLNCPSCVYAYDTPDVLKIEETPTINVKATRDLSAERKAAPVFTGVLMYFPDAIMEISRHSRRGGEKHAPGQPLHWAKEKSKDHSDCLARHLIDIGPNWDARDEETGSYHAAALAWRALALLQTLLEREKAGKK